MVKSLTVIRTQLIALFDASLADMAQLTAFSFLSSCDKFPLSCVFCTFILHFLFCFFMSPFLHFIFLFCIFEKMFLFNYLCVFLKCFCKWVSFSPFFVFAFRCIQPHKKIIHTFSVYISCNTRDSTAHRLLLR